MSVEGAIESVWANFLGLWSMREVIKAAQKVCSTLCNYCELIPLESWILAYPVLPFFEWLPCFSVVWPKENNRVSTVLKHIRCFQSLSTHEILVQRCDLQSNIWRSRTNYLPGVSFHFDHCEEVQDLMHDIFIAYCFCLCCYFLDPQFQRVLTYFVVMMFCMIRVCWKCLYFLFASCSRRLIDVVAQGELVSIECLLCCICYAVCSRHMWIQRHKLFFLLPDH
jgi:hypothetical protein